MVAVGNDTGVDMRDLVRLFENDESGATAIEYGLIAALASLAIISASSAMGVSLTSYFNWVSLEIQQATPP